MQLSVVLMLAQTGAEHLLDPPWNKRLVDFLGLLRAAEPRIETDVAPIEGFIEDLIPVYEKWAGKGLNKSFNDLLPILEQALKDLQEK